MDCIVALPDKLFFNTGIPASLWFVSKNRHGNGHRARTGEVLFIDARSRGQMVTRALRTLTEGDVADIAEAYNTWRSKTEHGQYEDVPGFCKVANLEEIAANDFVLTPGRYVGAAAVGEKIARLTAELYAEFERGRELEAEIKKRLEGLK